MSETVIQTLADALAARGYDTLTPVQEAVTDPALDGADLLVSAQTGSGKTVGFGLAIAPTLLGDTGRFGAAAAPLALIIAPTRELALQVKRELTWLYANTGAVLASCVGGMDMRDERRALDRGAHIVVATPGRLRDHIMRGSLATGDLRAVVLDEADEMLDLGFREDLEFILGEAPETRRTLMFSATVPKAIATLAQNYQKDAVRVTTTAEKSQHSDITYLAMQVAQADAENAIINVLRFYEAPNALVFCNTRAMVSRLTTRFSNRGFSVVALSGELTQGERTHALQAMRDGRARVCVATDVAARGIDLPNLELVIHAELPSNSEVLLHRSGRTGRAGRKGVSALIVPPKVRKKAERLLGGAKLRAEWTLPPSADEVRARDEERLLEDPVWDEEATEEEAEFAGRLLEMHGPEAVAAAYLRLFRARQSAPEDLSDPAAPPPPRPAFGPAVWFSVGVGRSQNAEPRWLLPMLCKAGGLSKDDIGAIRIQQHASFVEIAAPRAEAFMAAIGPAMQLEGGTALRRLDGPPEFTPRGPRPLRGEPVRSDPARSEPPRAEPARDEAATRASSSEDRAPGPVPAELAPPVPRSTAPQEPAGERPQPDRDKDAAPPRAPRPAPKGPRADTGKPRKPRGNAAPEKRFDRKDPRKPREGDAPERRFGKDGPRPSHDGDGAGKRFSKDGPRKPRDGDAPRRPDGPPAKRGPAHAGGGKETAGGAKKPARWWGTRSAAEGAATQDRRAAAPAKPKADARDTSKRFVPPGAGGGKPGKPASRAPSGGKTSKTRPGKGPDGVPRRRG